MEYLPEFRLLKPATAEEAVAARRDNPAARLLGGGTDLIPNMRRGLIETELVIDVTGIDELGGIAAGDDGLRIGAATTLADLAEEPTVAARYRAIAEAAGSVAGPTHRLMGTVGGNLCLDTRCIFYNQSEWWRVSNAYCLKYQGEICHVVPSSKRCYATYSGDLAAALLLYDAELEVAGGAGRRRMPLAELFVDDGAAHLSLAADEMLVAVHVPVTWRDCASGYGKIRVRESIDFPLAGVAVAARFEGGSIAALRFGLSGTNSIPVLVDASAELGGKSLDEDTLAAIERLIQKQVSPVRTTLIQPQYRRRAIAARARRLVQGLAAA